MAGYIREEPHFAIGGREGKISHFRLSDNYMRFYAGEIEPVVETTDFFHCRIDFATLLEKGAAP